MLPLATLRSPRVILRPFREDDVDGYYELHSDPERMRYWSSSPYTAREQAVAKVAQILDWQRDSDVFQWVITEPGDDQFRGSLALFSLNRDHRRCEVGYSLLRQHQGKGLATEALRLAVSYAFDVLSLERIEADVDPRNARSLRLLERVGFRHEGLLRKRWFVAGEACDSAVLGLLHEEFLRG